MRIRQSWPVLAVIICALHGLSYGAAAWAAESGQTVTVHRGGKVDANNARNAAALDSSGVVVVRGGFGAVRRSGPAPVNAAQQRIDRLELVSGEELWLIDRENNRLFNCVSRGNGRVGGLKIVCSQRRLPR